MVRQLESEKMQVLNVLGSSKLNKSNQVLSGCATISWLFEPSGPCSSDLSGFYLRKSFHKAFCSDVENTGSVYERDIISARVTQGFIFKSLAHQI